MYASRSSLGGSSSKVSAGHVDCQGKYWRQTIDNNMSSSTSIAKVRRLLLSRHGGFSNVLVGIPAQELRVVQKVVMEGICNTKFFLRDSKILKAQIVPNNASSFLNVVGKAATSCL